MRRKMPPFKGHLHTRIPSWVVTTMKPSYQAKEKRTCAQEDHATMSKEVVVFGWVVRLLRGPSEQFVLIGQLQGALYKSSK